MVLALFGILSFSWKIALERRHLLSCWGVELRKKGVRTSLGMLKRWVFAAVVPRVGMAWEALCGGRQLWWGWDQQDEVHRCRS